MSSREQGLLALDLHFRRAIGAVVLGQEALPLLSSGWKVRAGSVIFQRHFQAGYWGLIMSATYKKDRISLIVTRMLFMRRSEIIHFFSNPENEGPEAPTGEDYCDIV